MSKLTTVLKKVIGFAVVGSGMGQRWYWLCDRWLEFRRGQEENDKTLEILKANFECWELTRVKVYPNSVSNTKIKHTFVDYIFVVKDKKCKFIGSCQLDAKNYSDSIVIVNYTDRFATEEDLHTYNKEMEGMVSYEKV